MSRYQESRPCVLITGVGGRSVGHQILHAIRLLGTSYRVVAADADGFSFGLYMSDASYLVPLARDPGYMAAIIGIIAQERVEILLPGTEPEVQVLAEHRKMIESAGCRLIGNPPGVVALCSHKARLTTWLNEHGFATPRTAGRETWRALADEVGWPLVGKPCTASGGSRNVALLVNPEEVRRYLDEATDDVILQEYVATPDDEYTVGVMVGQDGELIDSIVLHRKIIGLSLGAQRTVGGRRYALSTGYSQGFIVRHGIVQRRCEELALALEARGPLNIQCRLTSGDIKVFEVHPRFSGTTSIRAEVGFNEPDVLIRNALHGTRFGRIDYQTDVAAIRALQHIIVPIEDMRRIRRPPDHG
ncbi:MAG: ATP-grasp domain-containing protein [Phycisphaerae bacterium]|nr:ATP-grasp domain-containing protein [Phycisphaerae bacterium]